MTQQVKSDDINVKWNNFSMRHPSAYKFEYNVIIAIKKKHFMKIIDFVFRIDSNDYFYIEFYWKKWLKTFKS